MKTTTTKSEISSLIREFKVKLSSSSTTSDTEREKLDALLHQLTALLEQETQAQLPLGPIALKAAAANKFSLEHALIVAHELAIPEKWTRKWFDRQKTLGWRDSYGNKIRSIGHYLSYCWRQECKPREQGRPRDGDLALGGYADYAKHGPKKPPVILPIPKSPSRQNWVEASKAAKQMVAELRNKLGSA